MSNSMEQLFLQCLLSLYLINCSTALLCYNCSTTHLHKEHCAGDFVMPAIHFNNSRKFLSNCTGERSMCFVRSWNARSRHAWIIQRGCYQMSKEDALPQSMTIPTRAMTCKRQRFADAEYEVCLCQADWCNAAPSRIVHTPFIKNGMWAYIYVYVYFMSTLIRTYI